MQEYVQVFLDGYYGYWNYLSSEILYPSWHNYFWWLLGISLVVWSLELVFLGAKIKLPLEKIFGWMAFTCFSTSFSSH
jgi:hypothetical protein